MSDSSVKTIVTSFARISTAVVFITIPILYFYFGYGVEASLQEASTRPTTYIDTFSSDYVHDKQNLLGPFKHTLKHI